MIKEKSVHARTNTIWSVCIFWLVVGVCVFFACGWLNSWDVKLRGKES